MTESHHTLSYFTLVDAMEDPQTSGGNASSKPWIGGLRRLCGNLDEE